MTIPFLDGQTFSYEIEEELEAAYRRVIKSGHYILGQELESFENAFASYCESKYCIGVGNGLDALSLILRAMDIGPGDEVIVPANTFIATWLAISHVGAIPVPIEPQLKTYNLDPDLITKVITKKTKAVLPVHLYGHPAEMEPICNLAKEHNIKVIEDAAQAHGAWYRDQRVGSLGDAAAFSFYPTKNLGAFGDGGAVVTNNTDLANKIRALRSYGSQTKSLHETRGFNTRLDELQAAFLKVKLKKLDEWNMHRAKIARLYLDNLMGIPGITLPQETPWSKSVWHLFVIRHQHRDKLKAYLEKEGIETLIHYPVPPHLQKAYQSLNYSTGELPVTEKAAKEILSLPMGLHIQEKQADHVIKTIKKWGAL